MHACMYVCVCGVREGCSHDNGSVGGVGGGSDEAVWPDRKGMEHSERLVGRSV